MTFRGTGQLYEIEILVSICEVWGTVTPVHSCTVCGCFPQSQQCLWLAEPWGLPIWPIQMSHQLLGAIN